MISFWTDERVATLKAMWDRGCSQAAIAKELGCSRGAVGGKCIRLGLLRGHKFVPRVKAVKKVVASKSSYNPPPQFRRRSVEPPKNANELYAMLKQAVENTK
jgi:hypothetical protein